MGFIVDLHSCTYVCVHLYTTIYGFISFLPFFYAHRAIEMNVWSINLRLYIQMLQQRVPHMELFMKLVIVYF